MKATNSTQTPNGGSDRRLVRALQFQWNTDIEKWTENAEALADKPEEAAYVARCHARAFEVRRCLNDLNSAFQATDHFQPNAKDHTS